MVWSGFRYYQVDITNVINIVNIFNIAIISVEIIPHETRVAEVGGLSGSAK